MTRKRPTAKRDYLGLVEAIYAPADTEDAWLQGIADRARHTLSVDVGVSAYAYDGRSGGLELRTFAESASGGTSLLAMARACADASPADALAAHAQLPRVGTAQSPAEFPADSPVRGVMVRHGVGDALAIKAHDPSGVGCTIVAISRSRIAIPPRTRGALERVAAHLASGFRLRQRNEAALESADAVFSAKGKGEHLSVVGVRAVLESAVAQRIHGHTLRRQAPEQALELWRGLVSGRWSLVDHVDHDGKRFVLARRNPPNVKEFTALTPNERAVAMYTAWGMTNKLIAYELGLAPSTVSGLLASSLRKLQLKSRTELATLFGAALPKLPTA